VYRQRKTKKKPKLFSMLCVTLLLLLLLLRRLVRIVVRILDENDDDDDDGIKDDGGAEGNNSSVNIAFLFAVDGVINVVSERGESRHFTPQRTITGLKVFRRRFVPNRILYWTLMGRYFV
jgi:hypothetical protein